jgi:hypothetical protein
MTALAAAPLSADQDRRRNDSERGRGRTTEQGDRGRQRAVPRSRGAEQQRARQSQQRSQDVQRSQELRREQQVQRQQQVQREREIQRQQQTRRQFEGPRRTPRGYDNRPYQAQRQYEQRRRDADRRYDSRRDYGRSSYSYRGYRRAVPRVIRPTIVTVIPYRPYVYRPRLGIGVYYGAGGSYPYGHTPRGYYDPIPGRAYGGLRITDAPREAQVFADGYYVGIVNDFDGIFQHLNLEAGPHRIEIEVPGYESIAFDVMVQPGRTTTFRANLY